MYPFHWFNLPLWCGQPGELIPGWLPSQHFIIFPRQQGLSGITHKQYWEASLETTRKKWHCKCSNFPTCNSYCPCNCPIIIYHFLFTECFMWISFDSSEQIIAIPSISSCIMINEKSKNLLAIMNNSITEQKNFSVASTNDHKENNIKQLPALNMQYHYRVLIYHSLQTQANVLLVVWI